MMIGVIAMLVAALPTGAAGQAAPMGAPSAAAQPSIFDKAINTPGIGWTPYGPNQTAKQVPAAGIPGGNAVQVKIAKAGANPWDSGVTYPTVKPIASGDTLVTMIFLRAPNAPEGQTVPIPVAMGGSEPPYPTITSEPLQVGSTWKRYFVTGVAGQAFAAGKANVSVQLAGAKQLVEVGPAFLLDMGPKFDRSKLPAN